MTVSESWRGGRSSPQSNAGSRRGRTPRGAMPALGPGCRAASRSNDGGKKTSLAQGSRRTLSGSNPRRPGPAAAGRRPSRRSSGRRAARPRPAGSATGPRSCSAAGRCRGRRRGGPGRPRRRGGASPARRAGSRARSCRPAAPRPRTPRGGWGSPGPRSSAATAPATSAPPGGPTHPGPRPGRACPAGRQGNSAVFSGVVDQSFMGPLRAVHRWFAAQRRPSGPPGDGSIGSPGSG